MLGVIGHVDHGKTALVRALTGMETDRLAEEKRRGISITLGFAHMALGDAVIDLVDMPGHERFVRTMVSGATGIDAVLLVVAANEGVKPQTVEHLNVASLLGLTRAAVVVTKADLVTPEQAALVAIEAAEVASAAGLGGGEPVITAVAQGTGLEALRRAIAVLLAQTPEPDDVGFPYLPVDRVFTIAGHGTVVTGTLRRGSLSVADEIAIVPGGRAVRARGLQVHGEQVAVCRPGQRVAVNLRGVEVGEVGRGTALTAPGVLQPSAWLTVQLRFVGDAPPLANGAPLRLLHGTAELDSRLRLLDRDMVRAGETALAQLHCAVPVAIPGRERFILRAPAPALTVAGGVVLDTNAVRLRRHAPGVLRRLQALADADLPGLARLELSAAGASGVRAAQLARLRGVSPARAAAALQAAAVVMCDDVAVTPAAFAGLGSQIVAVLETADRVWSREQLLSNLGPVGPAVLDEAQARLIAAGRVRREAGGIRAVRPEADANRLNADSALATELAESLRRGGLTPPGWQEIAPDANRRRLLDRLAQQGVVVRTRDSGLKRDVWFHRDAVASAQARLSPLLATPPGPVADGDLRGAGRFAQVRPAPDGIFRRRPVHPARCRSATAGIAVIGYRAGRRGGRVVDGGDWDLVVSPVFKTGGPPNAGGGFDSHPPPPAPRAA